MTQGGTLLRSGHLQMLRLLQTIIIDQLKGALDCLLTRLSIDVHFIEHRALHKQGQLKEREIDAPYVSTINLILHLFANALIERVRVRNLIVIDGQLSTRNDDGLHHCTPQDSNPISMLM